MQQRSARGSQFQRALLFAAVGALGITGCYSPKIPNATQRCAPDGSCATGYVCGFDGFCYVMGQAPAMPPDLHVTVDLEVPLDLAKCTPSSCSAPTAFCDPDSGECVACVQDSQCGDGQLCVKQACVPGCSLTHGCGDAGVCNLDGGVCTTCAADRQCLDPANPRCDLTSARCVPCLPTMDNCGADLFCVPMNGSWQCARGCKEDSDCAALDGGVAHGDGGVAMLSCCNHVCTNLEKDLANCGQCGTACPNNFNACCAGGCVDTTSDRSNCGRCGGACVGKNATWLCANSACAVAGCDGTFRDCNMSPVDGCETNVVTDPNNCLGCGKVCAVPNGMAACMQGCTVGTCNAGYADCDLNPVNGCEVLVKTDVNNCGACSHACGKLQNGTSACVAGACVIGSCNPNFADCNKTAGDGCEVNLKLDPSNCNACGMKCPPPMNGSAACANGVCGVSACNAPFLTCGGLPCAVNGSNDVNNCGQCGNACASVANGMLTCGAGMCGIGSCTPGFADCDHVLGNGCESKLSIDVNNCNGCGMRCPFPPNAGATCINGGCGLGACNFGFANCDGNNVNGCETQVQSDNNNCGACGNRCGDPACSPCSNGVCTCNHNYGCNC